MMKFHFNELARDRFQQSRAMFRRFATATSSPAGIAGKGRCVVRIIRAL